MRASGVSSRSMILVHKRLQEKTSAKANNVGKLCERHTSITFWEFLRISSPTSVPSYPHKEYPDLTRICTDLHDPNELCLQSARTLPAGLAGSPNGRFHSICDIFSCKFCCFLFRQKMRAVIIVLLVALIAVALACGNRRHVETAPHDLCPQSLARRAPDTLTIHIPITSRETLL